MFNYFAEILKSAGHITGIDASDKRLEVANQLVRANSLEKIVSLKKVNIFKDLPIANDYFDIIWLSEILFPDDFKNQIFTTLKKLHKVLNSGGKIAVFYGNWLRLSNITGV